MAASPLARRGVRVLMLDEEAVRRRLKVEVLLKPMEKALIDYSAGKSVQPVRTVIPIGKGAGYFFVMPACADAFGAKLVTFFPDNARKGLHTHNGVVVLFDPRTGVPRAVADARLITELRTAAVSAVATRLLSPKDAKVLGVLGSGVQARRHVEALRLVRKFEEIRVWSRTVEHARRFAHEVGAEATTAEAAVRGADVVVTATSATEPILRGAWLKPGAHVNAIGACRPEWRELDDAAMSNVVYVDSIEGAQKESGDVIGSRCAIYAELGEALAGRRPARTKETTIFKSLGMAVEDIAALKIIWDSIDDAND